MSRPSEFAPHLNAGSMTAAMLGTRGEGIASTSSVSTSDARRWTVRGASADTTSRVRVPSGSPSRVMRRRHRRRLERERALEISRHPRTGSFRARCVTASSVSSDDDDDAPNDARARRPGYDEYGREPKAQFRADVIANFPKFILASAGLIASGVALDLFRFYKLMIASGARTRWDELASGGNSGKDGVTGEPTTIYDVCGRIVATVSSQSVKLRHVAPAAWRAIVATEDHRFFRHAGVDVNGLGRAVVSMGRLGGGSTITQQLIKNMVLSNDRTVTRKLAEILLSLRLEKRLSKEQTLEAYVNNAYWGHGAFGISAASAAYFGKTPAQLDVGEASLLAALLPCPDELSPYANPSGALRARKTALAQMAGHGYLTDKEAREWSAAPLPATLELRPPSPLQKSAGLEGSDEALYATYGRAGSGSGSGGARLGNFGESRGQSAPYRAPFFVSEALWVLQDLFEGREELLNAGGLKVHTTLDLALQEKAERLVLEDGLVTLNGQDKGECALVAVDPSNGGVRVLIGSRDYKASAYNRAVRCKRTVGSAFVPFVYLAALELGLVTPATLLRDEEISFELSPEDCGKDDPNDTTPGTYKPPLNGGSDRGYRGVVTVRECLAQCLNVPAVKVAQMVGAGRVATVAKSCGVDSTVPASLPAVALGAGAQCTPMEIAVAYATIAAGGVYSKPHLITKVKDASGKLLYRNAGQRKNAVAKNAADKLSACLREGAEGADLGADTAVRAGTAGTSDDSRDAWFVGYTKSLACAVWCGRDDSVGLPGGGKEVAAPLWAKFMRAASAGGASGERSHGKGGRSRRQLEKWRSVAVA